MLFTGRGSATWIPVLPLLGGLAMTASVLLPTPPWIAAAIGLALVAFGIAGVRRIARVDGSLRVRGVLRGDRIATTAAFGYDVRSYGRSAATCFYVTDGERSIELWSATAMGSARADRLVARLRAAIPTDANDEARAIADAHRRSIAEREAPVQAYYASAGHRRTMILVAVGVVLYLAVMAVVTSTQ